MRDWLDYAQLGVTAMAAVATIAMAIASWRADRYHHLSRTPWHLPGRLIRRDVALRIYRATEVVLVDESRRAIGGDRFVYAVTAAGLEALRQSTVESTASGLHRWSRVSGRQLEEGRRLLQRAEGARFGQPIRHVGLDREDRLAISVLETTLGPVLRLKDGRSCDGLFTQGF